MVTYSGYSMSVIDYRSGEYLYGIISLNLTKIVSNPYRYMVMNGYDPSNESQFTKYVEIYLKWVVAHEMGHQLGLRHNFMGLSKHDRIITVMDYVDIFNDLNAINIYDPWGGLRDYDLVALKYGYLRLDGEQTGVKHPTLDRILSELKTPFGTDENFDERINPLITMTEDLQDPLLFVEQVIPLYRKYRSQLLMFVKNGVITPYEYNNLFILLYTQKYLDVIDICLKYIGGRYYDKNRTYFMPPQKEAVVRATTLLLRLLREIEYDPEEYDRFIYDMKFEDNRQLFNRVEQESIYSTNIVNLYNYYTTLIKHVFKNLIEEQRIIRLRQNRSHLVSTTRSVSPFQLLSMITFDRQNGLFPNLGILMSGQSNWSRQLVTESIWQRNLQYLWIRQLLESFKKTEVFDLHETLYSLLMLTKEMIDDSVIPYLNSVKKDPHGYKVPHEHGSHEQGSHERGSHERGSHEQGSHEQGSHEQGSHDPYRSNNQSEMIEMMGHWALLSNLINEIRPK